MKSLRKRVRKARQVLQEAREAHLAGDFQRSNRLALELWKLGDKAHAAYHQFYYHFRITRDFKRAEAMISFAIQAGIDTHQAWHNLGLARRDQANTQGALDAFARALEMCPDFVDSLLAMGCAAWEVGNEDLAWRAWDRALSTEAGEASAKFDQATIAILTQKEDYGRGWRLYAERWQAPLFLSTHEKPPGPTWDGQPIETLFLFAEQGNGDAIMLLRWLPWVIARAQRVHLAVHQPLVQIVRESFPDVLVQRLEDALPAYHAQCSLFDLPALAGIQSEADIPPAPYLTAGIPPYRPSPHRAGLVWAGGTGTQHDWRRSIPFKTVEPLLDIPLGWHILQLDRLEEFDASQRKTLVWHRDVAPLTNFAATARALKSLSLLITVDTSIAHLAGALNVPTWLMLPRMPDYRWGLKGERSAWYPSVRLFRQATAQNWGDVVQAVAMELQPQLSKLVAA